MKNIRYALVGAALFFISSAPLAFANTISMDSSSPTTPQPFSVFCSPYLTAFVSGNYYMPAENGGCQYSLPVLSGAFHVLQVYQGTVGSSTLIPDDDANTTLPNTILSTSPNAFNGAQDDDFFMVAYGVNSPADLTATENYLQTGSPLPSTVTVNILPWKWGVAPATSTDTIPPTVTINTPANGSSYLQNDNLFAMASTSDNVGVATTTYSLNGHVIDPALVLPLASQPLGAATLVVSASDAAGNVGYATSTFTILAPDLTPPTITISSPVQGKRYDRDDSVFLVATVSDASGISSVQYFFDGKPIDPSKPLPFKTVHIGTASTSVIAIDKFGNKATATVTFRILPSVGNGCFEDITDAFNHKYIADKMTFLHLFKDCADRDKYQSDRDNSQKDDNKKNVSYQSDSRYTKADQQYTSILNAMDADIGN